MAVPKAETIQQPNYFHARKIVSKFER
jgi:hypothetical protein